MQLQRRAISNAPMMQAIHRDIASGRFHYDSLRPSRSRLYDYQEGQDTRLQNEETHVPGVLNIPYSSRYHVEVSPAHHFVSRFKTIENELYILADNPSFR